jgi:predicted metal-dependent hydrolase
MAGLFARFRKAPAARPFEPGVIVVSDTPVTVHFKRHAQARRLVLRLTSDGSGVSVTVPPRVGRAEALRFAEASHDWIAQRIAAQGDSIALAPGSRIPLRGVDHEIRHVPARRGTVAVDAVQAVIHVPGELPHLPRRLTDWLKTAARAELHAASRKYAELMQVSFSRITIRDQRSRWGSCSAGGELSYSWRLILTPPHVLDYVAAHEVAHLKHMNHGPRFWRLVLTHCPDAAAAKRWLKAHGQSVHRIRG